MTGTAGCVAPAARVTLASAGIHRPPFRYRRVVSQALASLRQDGFLFVGLGLVFVGVPTVLSDWLTNPHFGPFPALSWMGQMTPFAEAIVAGPWQAWIALTVVKRLREDPVERPLTLFSEIWPQLAMITAFQLMFLLAVLVGAVMLVVPGLVAATVWGVGLPALVNEGLNNRDAFGRSAALTRTYRWPIFGLVALFGLPWLVIVVGAYELTTGFAPVTEMTLTPTSVLVLTPLLSVIGSTVTAVGVAVIYNELTMLEAGGDPDTAAEVFS